MWMSRSNLEFRSDRVISQTAEYALRAMICLAADPKRSFTTQQIADATRVPAGYLSKVLQTLGRGGLVVSQRGLGGGFALGADPKGVSVLDVINAVDPIRRIRSCPLHLKAHGTELCPLHRRLDDAMADAEKAFGVTTLAELLQQSATSRPLCADGRATCRAGDGTHTGETLRTRSSRKRSQKSRRRTARR